MTANNKNRWWIRLSLSGIFIFILLFTAAASLYPGGSYTDHTAKGYSWLHNYWCDLLSENAKNGLPNTARPVAITAWFVLCISLSIFWYILPEKFLITPTHKKIIRYTGVVAMSIAAVLFTSLHDEVIYLGGVFGSVSLAGIFVALQKSKLYRFFYAGIFCALLIGINYYIVLTGTQIALLPLIQKITFAAVLLWIFFICKRLYWYREDSIRL